MTLVVGKMRGRHGLGDAAERTLLCLSGDRLSAAALARRLRVSAVTAKRLVASLRRGGHEIASVRLGGRSFYEIRDALPPRVLESDPLLATTIAAGDMAPSRRKPGDAIYDHV